MARTSPDPAESLAERPSPRSITDEALYGVLPGQPTSSSFLGARSEPDSASKGGLLALGQDAGQSGTGWKGLQRDEPARAIMDLEFDGGKRRIARGMSRIAVSLRQPSRVTMSAVDLERRPLLLEMVQSRFFEFCVGVHIIVNAMYIGFETDNHDDIPASLRLQVEVGFLVLFGLEVVVRIAAYGPIRFFCSSTRTHRIGLTQQPEVFWNIFDVILVLLALVDVCIHLAVPDVNENGGGRSADLNMLTAVRVLKLLRIVRVVRLLKVFQELWLLVAGVIDAFRTLFWAWVLIAAIIFIFAIFTRVTIGQPLINEECPDPEVNHSIRSLFGTVGNSMFTFFAVMTTEGWGDIARCTMEYEGWTWALFMLFFMCTTLCMLNVVVAVIVESTLQRATSQSLEIEGSVKEHRKQQINQLYDIFQSADTDGDGMVTHGEFLAALTRTDIMNKLLTAGISLDHARSIFGILDYADTGKLNYEDFIRGIMRAGGEAEAKDVLALFCDVEKAQIRYMSELHDYRDMIVERLSDVDVEIERMHVEVRSFLERLKDAGQLHQMDS